MIYQIAPRITADESVCFGKPVIEGTRVPVDLVLGQLAGGLTVEDVAKEYDLTKEDVFAALSYASQALGEERFQSVRR